jgi:hypothetical protein
MVEVLAAAGGIDAGRLEMPGGITAYPYIAPGRWDHEVKTSLHLIGVGQHTTVTSSGSASTPPCSSTNDTPRPRRRRP